MVHESDIVELELRGKRFHLNLKKKEALKVDPVGGDTPLWPTTAACLAAPLASKAAHILHSTPSTSPQVAHAPVMHMMAPPQPVQQAAAAPGEKQP